MHGAPRVGLAARRWLRHRHDRGRRTEEGPVRSRGTAPGVHPLRLRRPSADDTPHHHGRRPEPVAGRGAYGTRGVPHPYLPAADPWSPAPAGASVLVVALDRRRGTAVGAPDGADGPAVEHHRLGRRAVARSRPARRAVRTHRADQLRRFPLPGPRGPPARRPGLRSRAADPPHRRCHPHADRPRRGAGRRPPDARHRPRLRHHPGRCDRPRPPRTRPGRHALAVQPDRHPRRTPLHAPLRPMAAADPLRHLGLRPDRLRRATRRCAAPVPPGRAGGQRDRGMGRLRRPRPLGPGPGADPSPLRAGGGGSAAAAGPCPRRHTRVRHGGSEEDP